MPSYAKEVHDLLTTAPPDVPNPHAQRKKKGGEEEAPKTEGAPVLTEDGVVEVPPHMPLDAKPTWPRKGKLSYTVYDSEAKDGASVEIQLSPKGAFYLKKGRVPLPKQRQYSWSKCGGIQQAWNTAKQLTAWSDSQWSSDYGLREEDPEQQRGRLLGEDVD